MNENTAIEERKATKKTKAISYRHVLFLKGIDTNVP